MKLRTIALFTLLLLPACSFREHARSSERDSLNQEADKLYHEKKHDRTVTVAKQNDEPILPNVYQYLTEICDMGIRRGGTEGEIRTGRWLADHFRKFGLETHMQEVPFPRFSPKTYAFTIREHEDTIFSSVFPMWYSVSTGPDGIDADLCHVGKGEKEDFDAVDVKGKIVVIEIVRYRSTNVNSRKAYNKALARGAVGVVLIEDFTENLVSPHGLKLSLSPRTDGIERFADIIRGTPRSRNTRRSIPGIIIGRQDGETLKGLMNNGPLHAKLILDVARTDIVSENVYGILHGTSDEMVVVTSPHDSFFVGASDSGAGLSCLAALAERYAGTRQEKTIMFLSTTSHYSGASVGIDTFHKHFTDEQIKKVLVNVHCGNGVAGEEYIEEGGKLVPTGRISPRVVFISENPWFSALVGESIRRSGNEGVLTPIPTPIFTKGEHESFLKRGVPVVAVMGSSAYYGTEADTLEKVPRDMLEQAGAFFAGVIDRILETPVDRLKYKLSAEPDAVSELRPVMIANLESLRPMKPPQVSASAQGPGVFFFSAAHEKATKYVWDFGDGTDLYLTDEPACSHTFKFPGKYKITVIACDRISNAALSEIWVEN